MKFGQWHRVVVVITTVQLYSAKPDLRSLTMVPAGNKVKTYFVGQSYDINNSSSS